MMVHPRRNSPRHKITALFREQIMFFKYGMGTITTLTVLCFAAFGLLSVGKCDENKGSSLNGKHDICINRICAAKTSAEKRATKEEISKTFCGEYNSILSWLKSRPQDNNMKRLLPDSDEILAIELLTEVQWLGAVDFLIDNIT